MAKWGEGKIDWKTEGRTSRKFFSNFSKFTSGDPRWIVEERPDATNVNNWHWKESNASGWSKDKLNELLLHFEISDGNISCRIIEFEKLQGEATANNRKGKLIYFYEWDLILKWQGVLLNDEQKTKINGKISIPNLSEENDLDEIDITVTVDESNEKTEVVKQFMYNVGRSKIREQIGKYMTSLKSDYAKNLILPKKEDVQVTFRVLKLNCNIPTNFWLSIIWSGTKFSCPCSKSRCQQQSRYK